MTLQNWANETRKILVCVDSYNNGVLQGRMYHAYRDMVTFSSLTQFLIMVEELLDEMHQPQSYTEPRTFSMLFQRDSRGEVPSPIRKGTAATFDLQVIFRQHTSWQGLIQWREAGAEHSFRSVLELVILMDSALRDAERSDGISPVKRKPLFA